MEFQLFMFHINRCQTLFISILRPERECTFKVSNGERRKAGRFCGKRSSGYRDEVCDLIGAITDAEAKFPTFYSLSATEFATLKSI
jgi:hypothetical protein